MNEPEPLAVFALRVGGLTIDEVEEVRRRVGAGENPHDVNHDLMMARSAKEAERREREPKRRKRWWRI